MRKQSTAGTANSAGRKRRQDARVPTWLPLSTNSSGCRRGFHRAGGCRRLIDICRLWWRSALPGSWSDRFRPPTRTRMQPASTCASDTWRHQSEM